MSLDMRGAFVLDRNENLDAYLSAVGELQDYDCIFLIISLTQEVTFQAFRTS